MLTETYPGTAPGNNSADSEWFIIAMENRGNPESYHIRRRVLYAGSLRGAENMAQEVLIQCRLASRDMWPCWVEIWAGTASVCKYGEVPAERQRRVD